MRETLDRIPGVVPVPGLPDSWQWSVGSGWFTFAVALSPDGTHGFQLNGRDFWDAERARKILEFAREHSDQVLTAAPISLTGGLDLDQTGYEFAYDVLAAAIPAVHEFHRVERPELTDHIWAVFPAFRFEFSGEETQPEAATRFRRMLDASNLLRAPHPYVKMRYDNPSLGTGSVGRKLGLATEERLLEEIHDLQGSEGAYIEFENFQRQLHRVEWRSGLRLMRADRDEELSLQELLPRVAQILRTGG